MPSPEPQREEPMRYRRSMTVGGTLAPLDDGLAASGLTTNCSPACPAR